MVFAISSSFDAVDLLSSELHNCQSISSCDRMSTDISDGLVGSEAGTSGGRSFAVLRKKRCQEMVSSGSEYGSTVGVAASVGSLVGVCLDSVDENTCLEDIICGFIYNSTVRCVRLLSGLETFLTALSNTCSPIGQCWRIPSAA